MRTNEIRLSDSEKQRLREYRNQQFGEQIPFGYVIGHLLEEATE
jgi:hypothetical protein